MIDDIHTVSKLIEISREYKMPLCLTFVDLKKTFGSVETQADMEALYNHGVPTKYIKPNLQKTMFMRNGWVFYAPFTLNGTNISECISYVYLGRRNKHEERPDSRTGQENLDISQAERKCSERLFKIAMLAIGVSRSTQVRDEIRSSVLRQ
ncbi:hypothetical protein RB195_014252 [Necator americanus]|uniref:Reverse transcriptase domain-containing protein n=1 Tax=Necator americanus TaxID=51031 RepID=A0ABR1DZ92_NECAM